MQTINDVILHRLEKQKNAQASVVTRNAALVVSEPVNKLVNDIHNLYASRPSKGFGRFEADEITFPTAAVLRRMHAESTLSFVAASHHLLSILADRANQEPFATGGYVLMARITNEAGVAWFIVAIINNVAASAIDEKTLEVVNSVHVDLSNVPRISPAFQAVASVA